MYNLTKVKIAKPANEVFEAFVDPEKIGNFWFTSSERWTEGKIITLTYDLYNTEGQMQVIEIETNKKIVFQWGPETEVHTVTFTLHEVDEQSTIIEVKEDGFQDDDQQLLYKIVDNKEGWVYMLTCLKAYLENGVTTLRGAIVK